VLKVLITGCAGFIGSHLTNRFLSDGAAVTGLDNLSRKGSILNLQWLKSQFTTGLSFHQVDIRDFNVLAEIFKAEGPFDIVIHEAAQVAVTTSVTDPREDFEINAFGTFNVLEAVRLWSPEAFFEFASTNKVYGGMNSIKVVERAGRYEYDTVSEGIGEQYNLDFHSPYGCSKGSADQYVRDYSRIYGLRTVVLRQSCIYGTHQFGLEDQGWVAWFVIASILNKELTIYGDGKQIRDLLWIDDLVEAYIQLYRHADTVAGQIYNVGGGTENTLSLLELVKILKDEKVLSDMPQFGNWRPGDQKVFVSNISKICSAADWKPTVSPAEGVKMLLEWTVDNKETIQKLFE
jgi:CDP-paratose 2-epimerase